jgi:hypothetical protein
VNDQAESAERRTGDLLARWGIDLPAGKAQPRPFRFLLATVVAVVLSLVACAALAAIGTAVFPSTIGYDHFRFGDYAKLTVIGVVLASFGWPAAAFLATRARRLYLVLAVIVSVVALAPDAWIIYQGQPAKAVLVLIAMHVALAIITYTSLVVIAPQRDPRRPA